jgi:hypothetical protein
MNAVSITRCQSVDLVYKLANLEHRAFCAGGWGGCRGIGIEITVLVKSRKNQLSPTVYEGVAHVVDYRCLFSSLEF